MTRNTEGHEFQLARYEDDGKLEFFAAHTAKPVPPYIVISHVWGEIQWLKIPGRDEEILASPSKARFIERQLPGLVGKIPFWMDTLTVNQKDPVAVIAAVQAIPSIFKNAEKTIAVREDDNFYECCAKAVEGFTDWHELQQKFHDHLANHSDDLHEESYLQRLWTLQECLLSHTVQFVVNRNGPKANRADAVLDKNDFFRAQTLATRVLDGLYTLAYSFCANDNEDKLEFMRAYIAGTTARRNKIVSRSMDEDIYTDMFRDWHFQSQRRATKPRDYVFATMPQFPWYHYPPNAVNMSFEAIFLDFYEQSYAAGHKFCPRIMESMISTEIIGLKDAWRASSSQPEPECLGDFLKLLGQRFGDIEQPEFYQHDLQRTVHHVTTVVKVKSLVELSPNEAFDIIEGSMGFSPRAWAESYSSGEISRFGTWPENETSAEGMVAAVRERGQRNELSERMKEELAMWLQIQQDQERECETDAWQFVQALRVLSNCWLACNEARRGKNLRRLDWATFREQMNVKWTSKLLQKLLSLAAITNCQLPLSAHTWIEERFFPVAIRYSSLTVLGLLAKHACKPDLSIGQHMFSVGRHTRNSLIGKDLVLADPATNFPVGLIPDFSSFTRSDEDFSQSLAELYRGLVVSTQPSEFSFVPVTLDNFGQYVESLLSK